MRANLPDLDTLRAQYRAGATYAELGRLYGCATSTVGDRLRGRPRRPSYGPHRKRGPKPSPTVARKLRAITAAREAGWSWGDIGCFFGISRQGAWQLYKKHENK